MLTWSGRADKEARCIGKTHPSISTVSGFCLDSRGFLAFSQACAVYLVPAGSSQASRSLRFCAQSIIILGPIIRRWQIARRVGSRLGSQQMGDRRRCSTSAVWIAVLLMGEFGRKEMVWVQRFPKASGRITRYAVYG